MRIAAESPGLRLTYVHVVATDPAVVALARPSESVNSIREMIRERLRLPSETSDAADLVHATPCRYRVKLSDPAKLLAKVEEPTADATAEVGELVIPRELVYPSPETVVLACLPLASH